MIVVTAPTSQIGTHVVRELIESGQPVRLIVRDATTLHDGIEGRAEVVEGSHGDPTVVDRAFKGAEALFWLSPNNASKTLEESFIAFARPAAVAIKRHDIKRVVGVTALGRGTDWQSNAGLVSASIAMDDLLMGTGAAFRGLAMPSFMENVARQVGVMKGKGTFFGPIDPNKKLPWTATRDIGTIAARWLGDVGWSDQNEVAVIGPEDLSFNDIAAVISEIAGRQVRYQQISFDQFKQQFLGRGASESFAQGYVDMYRAKNEGMDNVAARKAERRTRITFRQWAEHGLKPLLG